MGSEMCIRDSLWARQRFDCCGPFQRFVLGYQRHGMVSSCPDGSECRHGRSGFGPLLQKTRHLHVGRSQTPTASNCEHLAGGAHLEHTGVCGVQFRYPHRNRHCARPAMGKQPVVDVIRRCCVGFCTPRPNPVEQPSPGQSLQGAHPPVSLRSGLQAWSQGTNGIHIQTNIPIEDLIFQL